MFFNSSLGDVAQNAATKVKICGIQDSDMAAWCVKQGADAIGLMFFQPSPRFVSITQASAVINNVKGKIDIIGVFVNPSKEEVEKAIDSGITGLQFHGNETVEFCAQWPLPWLKAIHVDDHCHIKDELEKWQCAFSCLLDSKAPDAYGGMGKKFNWQAIPKSYRTSIVLSGGIHLGNVVEALSEISPFALDVSSGVESVRGQKSKALIRAFMQEVLHARKSSRQ